MFFENIKEAIISILSNKMRSLLTMLGIIIGISSVIIITTIGGSIQSTLTATMNSLGGNTVSGYVEARYPEDDADWDTWIYPDMTQSDYVSQEMIDELVAQIRMKFRVSLPRIILEAGRSRMRRIPTIMPMSVWMA